MLRRRSWPVLSGIFVLGLGIVTIAAVYKVSSVNGFRTGWQGIPVYLALAGIIGRVVSCKVIVRDEVLLVVNPLRTHIVPRTAIRAVSVTDDGTLEVALDEDRTIPVFAFGGSLVDRFRGTSDRAGRSIDQWLRSGPAASGDEPAPQVRWTRCPSADLSLVLCVVTAGAGAIWMAIGAS
ncbi:PH domain-containing protein [Streptomyces sp. NPDC056061]|uniref:PH domain-containing protein n=1 Tax=Streptomyces sp. NPDC056061 TaxID=3345700 RepID=UPI0035D5F49B